MSDFLAFHKLCSDGPFLVHIDATDGWHRRYCLSTRLLLTARFVTTIHCTQPLLWSLPNLSNSQVQSLGLGKLFPYTTWTMTMIHHRFRQPSLLFSTDHSPIWWKVHSQCSSNFSFSGFVGPETSLPMGLNSMDVAGACLLNAVLTKIFIRKQASLQSSHTTRSQQTRYHTFQTVPPLGSPLLRLSYSTCPAAWTISYTAY